MSVRSNNPRRGKFDEEAMSLKEDTIFENFSRINQALYGNIQTDDNQAENVIYYRTDLDPPEARIKLNGVVYKFTLTAVP